jgi:hypothetical protein
MALGGARPGAGRPKGSTNRPQLCNALTQAQIDGLIAKAHDLALGGDPTLLKFILEQIYGKAPQSFEMPGEGEFVAIAGFESCLRSAACSGLARNISPCFVRL